MFKGNETLCKRVSNTVTVIQHSGNLLRKIFFITAQKRKRLRNRFCVTTNEIAY